MKRFRQPARYVAAAVVTLLTSLTFSGEAQAYGWHYHRPYVVYGSPYAPYPYYVPAYAVPPPPPGYVYAAPQAVPAYAVPMAQPVVAPAYAPYPVITSIRIR